MPLTSPSRLPKLRRHSNGGAFVEINRKRIHLGARHGTKEAQQVYDRVIAEWLSNGRNLPPDLSKRLGIGIRTHDERPTVINLLAAYLRWAERNYANSPTLKDAKYAMRPLKKLYGLEAADDFGPRKLTVLRDSLIREGNWNRDTINQRVNRIKAIFRWGVAEELVGPDVWKSLDAVSNIRAGHTEAREPQKVHAVPIEIVEATLPHLSAPVAGLVRIQLATAARGGELFDLRPLDIDMSKDVWTCRLDHHKGSWRGKRRTLYFGPEAQRVLYPLLATRAVDTPFFQPADAGADAAKRAVQDKYDKFTYGKAIVRACRKAFPPPEEYQRQRVPANGRKGTRWETHAEVKTRIGLVGEARLAKWRKDHAWSPHQLRHLSITLIERTHGLEAARLIAGHSAASLTKSVYVEQDEARIFSVIKEVG